jgi:omega-6 fatty acid desaturase (delta-12 desaturase)
MAATQRPQDLPLDEVRENPVGRPASSSTAAAFSARTHGLTMRDLVDAIPRDCFERRLSRQLLGMASSAAVLALAYAALVVNPFWWLLPPLWFLAGTAAWGLYVIGHECGHGSFSNSRRLDRVVGHIMLTPFLYPFHSWRLLHNRHHANTNSIEKDIDWRPLPAVVYRKLGWRSRHIYKLVRTAFWWAGTLHQWATMAFDLRQFAPGRERRAVGVSIAVVAAYAALFFPALAASTGLWGLVKYWAVPWIVAHGWFSTITLTHHTHPAVPFLDQRWWSPAAASLCMTMYCRYPRWAEFLGHDINVHIPHHVAPSIPFYHLRRAHTALQERWPDLVRETSFNWRHLVRVLSLCHLYNTKTGFYARFSDTRQANPASPQ